MSWNNGKEKKLFIEEQKSQAEKYRLFGMSEDEIQSMHEYDTEIFNSTRRFAEHNQPLSSFENGEIFEFNYNENISSNWIDDIEDDLLLKKLKKLSKEDLIILTMIVIKDFSQIETATILKVSYRTIKRKYKKIKEILK